MMDWLGDLLGIEGLKSVASFQVRYAASWAHGRPALVLFCCLAAAALSAVFYIRYQGLRGKKVSIPMAAFRGIVLALLVWILSQPEAVLELRHTPRPLLVVLFDGTDSMNMRDKLPSESQAALREVLGEDTPEFSDDMAKTATRQDLVRATVRSDRIGWLTTLSKKFRLRGYVLDPKHARGSDVRWDQVREIPMPQAGSDDIDAASVARQLAGCEAKVTAIGAGLDDLRLHSRSHLLAGVVIISDFGQNRGQPAMRAAMRFKAPIYTVGVGPTDATDLAVNIQAPLVLKKGEKVGITVELHQNGLNGRTVEVELLTKPMGTIGAAAGDERFERAAPVKSVLLDAKTVRTTVTYVPPVTGRFTLKAHVEPLVEEIMPGNNSAERDVTIRDESLKLLFVEYEPTWEWRFIKEVFYRDPMIGRDGFRTYLGSADFSVRQSNDVFVERLVRSREEFFSYDVIVLSDVPESMLASDPQAKLNFQNMLAEYVSEFGGGLIVLAGPRFGPKALLGTKIADMLPVVIDENLRRRDGQFNLALTPQAEQYDFMRLADNDYENTQGWNNLRKLQWYQPSVRPHPLATVLASHPVHRCVDGKTPQPLIAIRRFGKGEVVYFAFNETWRLRKLYGEKHYSNLWRQLIYRMGLSRALGSQKRFRVETDRPRYQAGQKVRITVEAYDSAYTPLRPGITSLQATLLAPQALGVSKRLETELTIPRSGAPKREDKQPGAAEPGAAEPGQPQPRGSVIFETSMPVFTTGDHSLRVKDPITMEEVETTFKVAPTTAERRSVVRDVALQHALARYTGGKPYELHEIGDMAEAIKERPVEEISHRRLPLWNTWLVLVLTLVLMLGEWLTRKLLNLQ